MKPIYFPGALVVVAKDQPPYEPLPVQFVGGKMGIMVSCWELTDTELESVRRDRRIWVTSLTFNQPVQPLVLSADRPQVAPPPTVVKPRDPTARSPRWPHARRMHLLEQPTCQWCGGVALLEVHHILPFHLSPERELDDLNLITLCEAPGLNCHLIYGHHGDWHSFNVNITSQVASHHAELLAASKQGETVAHPV